MTWRTSFYILCLGVQKTTSPFAAMPKSKEFIESDSDSASGSGSDVSQLRRLLFS
jgi:hypothetical protein